MSKGGGGGQVAETSQQRAMADIGVQQMQDFKTRWEPVQQKFAADISQTGAADSFARRHATAQAGIDSNVKFASAAEKLDQSAAKRGAFGGSAQKMGMMGMEGDAATSTGLSQVAANQSVDNQYVQGLNAVTALGRGEKATAISGLASSAALSGKQAEYDAAKSLANRQGQYQLASTAVGIGAGLWGGPQKGIGDNNDLPGVNGSNAMDQFMRYGTSGD